MLTLQQRGVMESVCSMAMRRTNQGRSSMNHGSRWSSEAAFSECQDTSQGVTATSEESKYLHLVL